MIKHILVFILCLSTCLIYGQRISSIYFGQEEGIKSGVFLLEVKLDSPKKMTNLINKVLLNKLGYTKDKYSTLVCPPCLENKFCDYFLPKDVLEEKVSKYKLLEQSIRSFRFSVTWRTGKGQGCIKGIAPVYGSYPDSTFFYIPVNFLSMADSSTCAELLHQAKGSLKSLIHYKANDTLPDSVTVRNISFNDYNAIVQLPLKDIFPYIVWGIKTGELGVHRGMNFKPMDGLSALYMDFPNGFGPFENGDKKKIALKNVYLKEVWTDSVFELYNVGGGWIMLKKKIAAIGFQYSVNPSEPDKIIWLSYSDVMRGYFDIFDCNKNNIPYKSHVYGAYFESDFCKKVNMDFNEN